MEEKSTTKKNIKISIIIPFYKRLDFLSLIFQGLQKQSFKSFEVIVAEDDNSPETITFLESQKAKISVPIKHVSQPDTGFNKTKALNKSVKIAEGELIVFIDGDCIPHKHLLHEYNKHMKPNIILIGRRAMLSEKITNILLKDDSIKKINILNLLLSGSKKIEDAFYFPNRSYNNSHRGICGCNWAVERKLLLKVNGFDEDYKYATAAEDTDIDWRLSKIGAKIKKMKNKAIVYHLYHDLNYNKTQVEINKKLLHKKIKVGEAICKNGITKL
jgi:cellulose synthase/poly-beta-1,6-N-acetylglucosamine synthase-like glycosyltransferase